MGLLGLLLFCLASWLLGAAIRSWLLERERTQNQAGPAPRRKLVGAVASTSLALALATFAMARDLGISRNLPPEDPIASLLLAPAVCGLCAMAQALRLASVKEEARSERDKAKLVVLTTIAFGVGLCHAVPLAITLPTLLIEFVARLVDAGR